MTTPTFDPNIPQFTTDSLSITQPQFLRNFGTLFDFFLRNHVSISDPTNPGNHTFVELMQQLFSIETNVSEISVYTKDVEEQTAQIFFRYQGNGQEFQFTNYQLYNIPESNGRIQYFTTLPGKILVYFGSFNTLDKNKLELFPPVAKKIMTVSFCPFGTSAQTAKVYRPRVNDAEKNPNGFIDHILVFGEITRPPPCHYLILANL